VVVVEVAVEAGEVRVMAELKNAENYIRLY